MLLTIAIPAFDEVQNSERAIREARATAQEVAPSDAEVLIVDDGSRDGTGAFVDRLAEQLADIRVVRHERNRGFTGAMSTCFRHARGDWIFLAPADGQISMSEVKRFLTEIPRTAGRAKGGQLSVAVLTLGELVRVAILARLDENAARKVPLARRDSAR